MRRLLLALPWLAFALAASAQDWIQIPKPFGNEKGVGFYVTPYFLNPNIGFTFNNGIWLGDRLAGNTPSLARTTDGAQTWTSLPFFDTSGNWITQLDFVSLTHGYASTAPSSDANSSSSSGGIYETVDQGNHWTRITPDGLAFSGVYSTKGVIFASEIRDINYTAGIDGEILFSKDDGATWDSITNVTGLTVGTQPEFQWIYGNRDSLVATVYFGPGSFAGPDIYLVFSTDLGSHWQSSLLDKNYGWDMGMVSMYLSPHSCNVIREHLDNADMQGDTYTFLEASPPFTNWNPSLLHRETGAWIAGSSCVSYLSDASSGSEFTLDQDSTILLFRSTDEGNSWQPLKKQPGVWESFMEIDDEDFQNLSVVGHGAVVYASENPYGGNKFWKTTNGGDGTLSASALAPEMALAHAPFPSGTDTLEVSECSPSSMLVTNINIGCSYATFDSATIVGLGPSEYSVTSTHYCGCTRVPDTSFITLAPKQTGIRNITVHFHYTDDEYNQIDTTLPIVLDVKSGGVPVPLSLSLGSGTMVAHAGDTIQIPVYLASDSTITVDPLSMLLPFSLDTNVLKVLGFVLPSGGNTVDSLKYVGGTGTVPLQIANLTISGKTLIGTLRCVVYLADTLATNVSLQGASINTSGGCIALSTDLSGVNIALTGCGDSTLLRFMQTGQMPFSVTSVNPNPARGILTARIVNPRGEAGRYRVLNALGAVKMEGNVSSSEIEMDVAPLSNGIYLLQVESPSGFVSSRRFLIER